MGRLLKQGWSLIDFDDTKTLIICILILLLSVSKIYFEPKTKISLKGLEMPYPVEGSKSPSQGSESLRVNDKQNNRIQDKGFESLKIGYKSQFQRLCSK